MSANIPEEQLRGTIERIARAALGEAGCLRPPVNALAVAKRLGLLVLLEGSAPQRARFTRVGGMHGAGAILLANEPRVERRHWAVAHEIGESLAWQVFTELGVDPADARETAREAIANRLASCLLLPRAEFHTAGETHDWDLMLLKERFATASHELVARRMLEMPRPAIITLFDQNLQQWRRSNVGRVAPLSAAERDARRAAFELGKAVRCEPSELPEGVVDVRAWPIHEAGWKREIVRTELAEAW